jgi:hypothetical protein
LYAVNAWFLIVAMRTVAKSSKEPAHDRFGDAYAAAMQHKVV